MELTTKKAYTKNTTLTAPLLGLSEYSKDSNFCVYLGFHAPIDENETTEINNLFGGHPYAQHWLAAADDIYFSDEWIASHHFKTNNIFTGNQTLNLSDYSGIKIDKYGHIIELIGKATINSIKWASTSQVNGTWGTTPSLGNITLTYTDNTTQSKAYNVSGVSLYTNSDCTTAFSNANPGTFDVWAKYTENGSTWKTTNKKTVVLGKKDLTITKGSSPSSISDGSTGNVTFTTNVSATITLTTISGTGWTAQLTSSAGTSHTIKVTNTTGGSAGSISADAIKVTAVATDTAKYNNITTDTGVNTKITLSAPATTYKWYTGHVTNSQFESSSSLNTIVTNNGTSTTSTTGPSTLTMPTTTGNVLVYIYPTVWGTPTIVDSTGYGTGDMSYEDVGLTPPSGYKVRFWDPGNVEGKTLSITWVK